ncbi:MAG: glycosyltransferase family 2 protein [Phycisphaerales bacterium]|nr:glycosyltransferase family 2 protein [Phycisphaerales bacterium]
MRTLIAIPVFNESRYVDRVLQRLRAFVPEGGSVLVIDDGSTDDTPCLLPRHPVEVIRHARNRGYGRSLMDAFRWAAVDRFDWVVTMDCDEQHEPESIPDFLAAAATGKWDVVSGSRYLRSLDGDDLPPENRRRVNAQITRELNDRLGLNLTDAFCGFKAYRVRALANLKLDVDGYAFPLQFWAQAAAEPLRITEIPVRLIYKDRTRNFGGVLDDDAVRLEHYRQTLHRDILRLGERLPEEARAGLCARCLGVERADAVPGCA